MTTGHEIAGNRQRVFDLLAETRDLKMLKGDLESLIRRALEAYGLAKELHSPWREVAAYRLAQLLFRKSEKTLDSCQSIDQLLKEAGGNSPSSVSPLGPLPWVYRMASLHRLSLLDPMNSEKYRVELEQARESAMRRFRPRQHDTETTFPDFEMLGHAQIQSDQFNLIELATYFTDLPYGPLSGRDHPGDDGFSLTGRWVLVSNQLETGSVNYSREFAEAEVRALMATKAGSIGFRLQGKNDTGHWLREDESQSVRAMEHQLALLANVLIRNGLESSDLQRRLDLTDVYVRQLKRRLAGELNKLYKLTGRNAVKFAYHSYRLVSEVPIFGAVHSSVISGH